MKILRFSLFIILLSNLTFSQIKDEKIEIAMAVMEGSKQSEEDFKKIEEKLKENPGDLTLRAKVLGYCIKRKFEDENLKKKFQENVLWIIKNKPESALASSPYILLDPSLDGEVYNESKKLWLENIEKYKENINVLSNAGNYFKIYDKEISIEIYEKLKKIEPENPKWYKELGHIYSMQLIRKKNEEREEVAKKSLQEYEKAYNLAKERNKITILPEIAEVSFEAGDLEKAKNYSIELLNRANVEEGKWFYGSAVHYANIVLGKIALKENKKEEAKKYLIEAGKTPGSPQLNSFGPDFSLAEKLLFNGEKDAVLEYLKLCEKFWKSGSKILKKWQDLIKGGKTPEFSRKY